MPSHLAELNYRIRVRCYSLSRYDLFGSSSRQGYERMWKVQYSRRDEATRPRYGWSDSASRCRGLSLETGLLHVRRVSLAVSYRMGRWQASRHRPLAGRDQTPAAAASLGSPVAAPTPWAERRTHLRK